MNREINGVMMQYFEWYLNCNKNLWNTVKKKGEELSRLGITDGAILKIAIYELLYTTTPHKVCIDEAIELAKCFSDEPVIGMINGVLDKVYHEKVQEK